MARCSVCDSQLVGEIDQGLAAKESLSSLARRYGVSRHALGRHREAGHMGPVVMATPVEPEADSVVREVRALLGRAGMVLDRAERKGHHKTMLGAIGEMRKTLELVARLIGELDERPRVTVNLWSTEEFRQHLVSVRHALAPYPEAAAAVALALASGNPDSGSPVEQGAMEGKQADPNTGDGP